LGDPIKDYYGELYAGALSMSTLESAFGLGRVRAALPPSLFGRLFPSIPLGAHASLASSEANMWSLPAAETTSTDA
jgi:hypothetical protein